MKLNRWKPKILFAIDAFIVFITCYIIYYWVPNGSQNQLNKFDFRVFLGHICIIILSITLCQWIIKSYKNIWKYAEYNEYIKLILGVISGFLLYILPNYFLFTNKTSAIFSISSGAVSALLMLLVRFLYKKYRKNLLNMSRTKLPLAIIGAGGAGVLLLNEILYNPKTNYSVLCFIDDDNDKIGKKIRDIMVYGPIDRFPDIIKKIPVSEVIIAIPSLTEQRKSEILEIVTKSNIKVKFLPDLISILQNGPNLLSSVREFKVENLLGRKSVSFDETEINSYLKQKTIMVTGGGGSIGSELCRQIARSNPKHLIIIDNYENNAFDIQQELISKYNRSLKLSVEIASVQDREKIETLFERYRPEIIFHAAAHKHVSFMEDCTDEAIKNNVFGTYNTVQAAHRYQAKKFVLISTDKAVNPTSMMGASKRVCEMIVQSMKEVSLTNYVTVRFGNVLGSNGSVIPLFKRQIEQGGPVTITDKRAYRYFMTISEAAQLVLRASSMDSQSETYVLDMGQPVNILTLAENLIRLMGYIPYTEIPIKEIGIRPGEKLYEELLMHNDDLIKTENAKIFIEKYNTISQEEIEAILEKLRKALETKDMALIKEALIEAVPTFKKNVEKET
ncbi:MAG: polysaccharide biosynthesis protein [Clostridiales bacterium]|nr:polysaccharide biosynthesis protein [Clostridiales bacterium]